MYQEFNLLSNEIKIAVLDGYPCPPCLKNGDFRYLGNNRISIHHWKSEKSFLVHLKTHDLNHEDFNKIKNLLREFSKTDQKNWIQFLFEKGFLY